jgi:uncharacterized protein YndB with AHSA1/START domain
MRARRDVYQAIADPTRRAIIHLIAEEALDITTLTEKFEITQQAVSLHVRLLVDCGLVRMEQRGRNRFCHAQLGKLQEVANWAGQYRKFWNFKPDDLAAYMGKIRNQRSGVKNNGVGDKEIRVSRLLDAPVARVWEAWTHPVHLVKWWGPAGSSTTVSRMDVKPGGQFDLVMRGSGREIDSMSVFEEVVRHRRIVYRHLTTPKFTTTIGFEPRGKQTFLTWSVAFEMIEQFNAAVEKYGALEFLKQAVDRFAAYARP